MAWFWEHTEPFGVTGLSHGESFCFNPTANLLYLAGHLGLSSNDVGGRLIWNYDLMSLFNKKGDIFDWQELSEEEKIIKINLGFSTLINELRMLASISNSVELQSFTLAREIKNVGYNTHSQENFSIRPFVYQALFELRNISFVKGLFGMLFPSSNYIKRKYMPNPKWVWPMFYLLRIYEILLQGQDYFTKKFDAESRANNRIL